MPELEFGDFQVSRGANEDANALEGVDLALIGRAPPHGRLNKVAGHR